MASVNKVIILGNVGKDPETRYTQGGAAICNVSIATSRQWKDKTSGERQEETEWHRVTFFERLAEVAGEYLKKGKPVYVEGRLKTRKYTDKDGVEKYATEIVATEMQLLGGKEDGEAPRQSRAPAAPPRQPGPPTAPRQAPAPRPESGTGFDEMDDDIPF